jgi:hypothetical protein
VKSEIAKGIMSTASDQLWHWLQELPAMMEKGSKVRWGNCIGFWIFPFSLKQFSDPLEHVRAAMKVSDRLKASLGGRFTFWVGRVLAYCGVPTVCFLFLNPSCRSAICFVYGSAGFSGGCDVRLAFLWTPILGFRLRLMVIQH